MKMFVTSQIKSIDEYTILNEPIPSIDLMERASQVFTDAFKLEIPAFHRIIVFAGPGNNGGDALGVARMLIDSGYRVETFLFNPKNVLSSECEKNKELLLNLENVAFTEVKDAFTPPALDEDDIVIDGLFGSGLNKPLSGGFASVVKYINKSKSKVISIDIPSGLFGEDNTDNSVDTIIHADRTFTFQFPKLAFFLPENECYVGEWKVLDIQLHPKVIEETLSSYYYLTKEEISRMLKKRSKFAHKGNFGHALLIAGSYGKIGAAVLAAKACLRNGAGLLTVHLPQEGNLIMQSSFPEALVSADKDLSCFSEVPDLNMYDAIGVGPGLGLHEKTFFALEDLLQQNKKPLVVDADALNIIAQNKYLFNFLPEGSILTPHPKEFDRLFGVSESAYARINKALEYAARLKCFIILKGAYTVICTPEQECFFNTTGNPGMATAGSGDVLTGIILGLLSKKYTPKEAALIGVYLHGLAGDLGIEGSSEESLIASDIIKYLGLANHYLMNGRD